MITPLFVAFPNSQWRDHVKATWNYLQGRYEIIDTQDCGTHVHISVEGGYSLEELKRVAQAALYFETSFDALVPQHRRKQSDYARSVWVDSPDLAANGVSRIEAMLMISQITDLHKLLSLMNPNFRRGFSWNFRSIIKYYTVEFRKPPASKTAQEALNWAEFAMTFVQTAIRYGTLERLVVIPPTVGGLRWFLRQTCVPRLNKPGRLEAIWKGKYPNAFIEARPLGNQESEVQLSKINQMIEADRKRIIKLTASTAEPYWPEIS